MRRTSWLALALGLTAAAMFLAGSSREPGRAADVRADSLASPDSIAAPHRVVVTYFHTDVRCASCRKIEAYAREAVEEGFPEAVASGRLVWEAVNLDAKGNRRFVDQYELYTKSVILSDRHHGEEARWKNLPKVWTLLGNREAFLDYVREETKLYLEEDL